MSSDVANKEPRVFISYSWTTEEHEAWVLQLATELRESGVDIILDKWDLREGQDAHAFMEKMVVDPKVSRVILVCDARYVDKANARVGGVGTEAQIISPAIYGKVEQKKFVAVVRERNADGQAYLPTYYGSRIYIDMSSDALYPVNFDQLLRWIFDKPVNVKPALGKRPTFLEEAIGPSLENTALHRRAIEALRSQKSNSVGLVEEYLESCVTGLEKFRIADAGIPDFDDKVVVSIEAFTKHRDEVIELVSMISRYESSESVVSKLHRFFESILPYYEVPEGINGYRKWDYDNYKFIGHELFVYAIAVVLKSERFDLATALLSTGYYLNSTMRGPGKTVSFIEFCEHMDSLEERNKRLNLRRLSVRSDMLRERSKGTGLDFRQLAQADFVLFVRSSSDALFGPTKNLWGSQWWPYFLIFVREYDGPFEVFARSKSLAYFNKLKPVLGVKNKDQLGEVLEAFQTEKLRVPTWQFERVYPKVWMGFDELATVP